jgi:hypothetical protein
MDEQFEKASFGAKKGSIVGPVESEYGFHIIKVNDRTTKQFVVRDWKIVPQPGERSLERIRSRAYELRNNLIAGGSLVALYISDALIYSSGLVRRNHPIEGTMALNRFAFTSKLGEISDVLALNNGSLVVAQLTDIRAEGPIAFNDLQEEIMAKLRTKKKLDMLSERARGLRAKVSSNESLDALPSLDPAVEIHEFSEFYSSSSVPGVGSDSLLVAAIFNQEMGTVSPLIRGEYGYYIVAVNDGNVPTGEEFETERQYYIEQMKADRQSARFYDWLARQREEAEIVEGTPGRR